MFPISLLVVLCYKSHQVVICSNFWRCKPTVMFSYMSLFNLDSCELYRFMSHIWRQSNCMTMIMRSILFISLWVSVEELTGKSHLLMVSSDTIPFLQSLSCQFLLCKLTVVCQPGESDRENYLELLAEVESW